jgi:hypothetical protein
MFCYSLNPYVLLVLNPYVMIVLNPFTLISYVYTLSHSTEMYIIQYISITYSMTQYATTTKGKALRLALYLIVHNLIVKYCYQSFFP